MFELLFKYPASVFSKGKFVLMGSWPHWVFFALALVAAVALGWLIWHRHSARSRSLTRGRAAMLWGLQSPMIVVLLLLLWEPAISITVLRPQQNIIAVVVDDSRSMSLNEGGRSRQQQAVAVLDKLVPEFRKHYQVRLYGLGASVSRIGATSELHAALPATRIDGGMRQLADEAGTLPIGAVVLLSDGSDNSSGIGAETISELRRRRLPVNTIGFGRETLVDDVELEALDLPSKALASSRLQARVHIRQNGFSGRHATLSVTGDGGIAATRDVVLRDVPDQIETLEFNAGRAGVKDVSVRLLPLSGERNVNNNRVTRVINVDGAKRRLLYVEGEPRWEFKFLRRAVEDDPAIEVVSMLRTTQNKIYRQGIANPNELAEGFPIKPEELFEFQGLIIGSVESAFFGPEQQQAIKDFVDRRGGGLLLLGGRAALADGGYDAPPFAELLPVVLPNKKNTFHRQFVAAELTDEGKDSLVCRIEEDAAKNADHWEVLPYLADYEEAGTPKKGAVTLVRVDAGGNRLPLLVTENYGRGRTAVFATGGSWRWRMQQPVADTSQQTFWRQLIRWTAGSTPSRVVASTAHGELYDDGHLNLRAEVRDAKYAPTSSAQVEARVITPDGSSEVVRLRPDAIDAGIYTADWNALRPGSYVAEIRATEDGKQLGSDVLTFRREDGVAEDFHQQQNRDLLEKLAAETGGRYYTPRDAMRLPEEISFSEAGISARETKDLWNMPAIFLAVLLLRSAEWILRRRWGFV